MLEAIRNRMRDRDEGFTLIELMVVVLIIAILVAIAIPTFLGARSRAQDKAAQSSARNALTAAKTLYTDAGTYTGIDATALSGVEPSLTYAAGGTASTSEKNVSVNVDSSSQIFMAVLSDSGSCFALRDNVASGGGTFYATLTGACSGDNAETETVTGASW